MTEDQATYSVKLYAALRIAPSAAVTFRRTLAADASWWIEASVTIGGVATLYTFRVEDGKGVTAHQGLTIDEVRSGSGEVPLSAPPPTPDLSSSSLATLIGLSPSTDLATVKDAIYERDQTLRATSAMPVISQLAPPTPKRRAITLVMVYPIDTPEAKHIAGLSGSVHLAFQEASSWWSQRAGRDMQGPCLMLESRLSLSSWNQDPVKNTLITIADFDWPVGEAYPYIFLVRGIGAWAGAHIPGARSPSGLAVLGDACLEAIDVWLETDYAVQRWGPYNVATTRDSQIGAMTHEMGHALGLLRDHLEPPESERTIMGAFWNFPDTGLLPEELTAVRAWAARS